MEPTKPNPEKREQKSEQKKEAPKPQTELPIDWLIYPNGAAIPSTVIYKCETKGIQNDEAVAVKLLDYRGLTWATIVLPNVSAKELSDKLILEVDIT
jgi:hypothetical protein